jgi:hypothetical protein
VNREQELRSIITNPRTELFDRIEAEKEFHALIREQAQSAGPEPVKIDRDAAVERAGEITRRLRDDPELNWKYAERQSLEKELADIYGAIASQPREAAYEPPAEETDRWRDEMIASEGDLIRREMAAQRYFSAFKLNRESDDARDD